MHFSQNSPKSVTKVSHFPLVDIGEFGFQSTNLRRVIRPYKLPLYPIWEDYIPMYNWAVLTRRIEYRFSGTDNQRKTLSHRGIEITLHRSTSNIFERWTPHAWRRDMQRPHQKEPDSGLHYYTFLFMIRRPHTTIMIPAPNLRSPRKKTQESPIAWRPRKQVKTPQAIKIHPKKNKR